MVGKILFNHIYYADDLVLIAPSQKGLQYLLNICGEVGSKLEIIFNEIKAECVIFKTKQYNNVSYNSMLLNGKDIRFCQSFKYLCHVFRKYQCDDDDIKRQISAVYARGKK